MKIQALLFDLDGTLANTLPLCIKVYKQAFEHYAGRPVTDEEVTQHFGITEAGIFQRMLPEQWEEALAHFYELYEQTHHECPEPFAGVLDALNLLRERGVRMALITGKGMHTAQLTLRYLGLAEYFDYVEAGKEDAIVKAHAITKILQLWNIDTQYAAYIGDSDTDMLESHIAGVLPLAAEWAETATIHKLIDMEPYIRFHQVTEFIEWIKKHVESNLVPQEQNYFAKDGASLH